MFCNSALSFSLQDEASFAFSAFAGALAFCHQSIRRVVSDFGFRYLSFDFYRSRCIGLNLMFQKNVDLSKCKHFDSSFLLLLNF
jgi:hypothetical protein